MVMWAKLLGIGERIVSVRSDRHPECPLF